MAQAPRLWKYGVQREVANKVPSERASCSRVLCSCMLATWDETQMNFCGGHRNGNRCFIAFAMEIDHRC
jgi:hypothetical protein